METSHYIVRIQKIRAGVVNWSADDLMEPLNLPIIVWAMHGSMGDVPIMDRRHAIESLLWKAKMYTLLFVSATQSRATHVRSVPALHMWPLQIAGAADLSSIPGVKASKHRGNFLRLWKNGEVMVVKKNSYEFHRDAFRLSGPRTEHLVAVVVSLWVRPRHSRASRKPWNK